MKKHTPHHPQFIKPAVIGCLLIFGCNYKEKTARKLNFIVTEKIVLNGNRRGYDYFLKSKDTTIYCSSFDYASTEIGDTLKLEIPQDGFFKGTVCRAK